MSAIKDKDIAINGAFLKAYDSMQPGDWQELVTELSVAKKKVTLPFLGGSANMREFKGEADARRLIDSDYSILTKSYHDTIKIDEFDLETDDVGLYKPNIDLCARNAKDFPRLLILTLLNNAFTGKDYTGSTFIGTKKKHLVDEDGKTVDGHKTFDNLMTGELNAENLMAAKAMLQNMTNPYGVSLGLCTTLPTLIIPPALELAALKIIKDYEGNVTSGVAKIKVMPGLTSPTAWFLADLDNPIKPFVLNNVSPVKTSSNALDLESSTRSERSMETHVYMWQVFARWGCGYGASTRIVGSTGV